MQNSVAKKIFAVGSAAAIAISALAPLAAFAAPDANGTNISDSTGTVYTIINGQRDPYTSAGAFLSYGFNSWANVVPASSDDLALPVGSFIPPQDGSIICSDRGADQGTCYEISSGQKYGFTSAAVFTGLGFSFTNSMPGDVSWMTAGPTLISSATQAHLPGTLINNGGTVQLVGTTGLLGVPDLATFNSWGYSFSKVVPANAADTALPQTGVFAARVAGQLSPTWTTNPGNPSNPGSPVVSGNVSASLSSDTPAAGTVVANINPGYPGQTGADLAHFTFNGSGTVTQVVVNRIGVSSDNSLSNVYLYQGNNRITSAGSFSNGQVTFTNSNGLFTVSGSVEISVKVDIAAGATSGQTLGAQLASFTVANGSPMTSSISGNLFQIASVSNLATAALSGTSTPTSGITSSGASQPTATGSINAGTTNAILWQAPITIGQRTVLLKHIAFTQIGSIQSSAITNYQLYVDGSLAPATPTITTAGGQTQVVFDMPSNPVSLNTGSHNISLQGNIVGGTSFTFEYSLQTAADIVLFDTNYNVNVPLTYSTGGTIFQVVPGLTTISSGTISVQTDPAFTATQFVANSSSVVLGQWDLTAYGENVNVNQLQVALKYTSTAMANGVDGFNNLTVTVNGGSVGSSQGALATTGSSTCGTSANETCTYTFGTTNLFTIQAGQTVTVQVKGDSVINGTDITAVQASLITPSNSLQGQTSFALSGSGQSYAATALTTGGSNGVLAKNTAYSNQTVSSNQSNQEIGSYIIQAGSIDGIRLNQVTVGLNGNFAGSSVTNALTNLSVSVTYPGGSASTTPVNPQSNNTFTLNNVTIPANQAATVSVYANIGNFTGSASTTLYSTAQGLTSNQSLTGSGFTSATAVVGQNITVGSGVLTSAILNAAQSPQSSYVASLSASQPVATFNFYATSTAGITITELGFTTGNTNGAIASVTVGGVTSYPVGSSTLVTGLSIPVPFGTQGISVPVTVSLSKTGSNGITGGDQAVTLTLAHVKYIAGGNTTSYSTTGWNTIKSTSDATTTIGTLGINAPAVFLVGSPPSLSVTNTTNGSLTNAQQHLIDLTVSPPSSISGSSLQVNQVAFTVNQSGITGSPVLSNAILGINGSNTAINQSSCLINGTATSSLASTATVTCTLPANYNISGPVTFSLFATLTGGTLGNAGTSSITAQLAGANTFAWTDISGDNSTFGTGGTYSTANATYLQNYPTSTWYTHN